jgi:hypothetical protein
LIEFPSASNDLKHKILNDEICEAFGCCEKAVTEIKVDAGKFGIVTLFVCERCIGKFQD